MVRPAPEEVGVGIRRGVTGEEAVGGLSRKLKDSTMVLRIKAVPVSRWHWVPERGSKLLDGQRGDPRRPLGGEYLQ